MNILSYALSLIPFVCAAEIGDEVRKWVLFGFGVLSAIVTLGVDVYRLIIKHKQANADGVITKEEQEELDSAAKQLIDDLKPNRNSDNINDEEK